MLGLCCCAQTLSSFIRWGLLSSCGAQASHRGGLSFRGAQALGCTGFSSCDTWAQQLGTQAQLSCSTWDLLRPGIESVSPALIGEYLTTGPPGRSLCRLFS